MSLLEQLHNEPFILILSHFELLSFTCLNPSVLLVQVLLNIFETHVAIDQLIRLDQPVLAFLIIIKL